MVRLKGLQNKDRTPRILYYWKPTNGRRKRGRPRTTWKDVIKKDFEKLDTGWTMEEAKVAAKYTKIWPCLSCQAAGAGMHDASH
jgi:hypothetical protein